MALTTGNQRVLLRDGFCQKDDFDFGLVCANYGPLDAPDLLPQGSVRDRGTIRRTVGPSIAHREGASRPAGAPYDA